MTRENIKVTMKDMEVVNGKVVISSEELAAAVQSMEIDLGKEEGADALIDIDFGCNKGCSK